MERKIEFNEIIAFIRKAMDNNYIVKSFKDCHTHFFKVENGTYKNDVGIKIYSDHFYVDFINTDGFTSTEYNLTDRDYLVVEELYLDVREYNEKRAINTFNNFFYKEDSEKEVVMDINSLNDDD